MLVWCALYWAGAGAWSVAPVSPLARSFAPSPRAPGRPSLTHAVAREAGTDAAGTLAALWQMARPRTLPQSVVLLLFGAYGAELNANFLFRAAARRELCLLAATVVLTTATSMLVNDYHDFALGVDTAESRAERALVRGSVTPEVVKAVCKCLYAVHILLTLLVREPSVRLCVYANTLATFLYSKWFKPVPIVKNALCATVISTTVALGATVVTGSLGAAVRSVWKLMLLVGCGIAHREMVMDVDDMRADGKAGVRTVPVLVGARPALALSCAPLALPIAASIAGRGISVLAVLPLVAMCALAARAAAEQAGSAGFHTSVGCAVELAPLFILLSLAGALRT
ncbi:hypothetical protein KFE25_004267 [Diacronema lutheri]|uniref:Uncharacterized protein n=1 Tax=Diacronema lutheri TaxID=2081491 RepID=A0A8J6C8Z5_DIALT|nr:hypothetical protein KFE25_004267 [Diacronema lutheri]